MSVSLKQRLQMRNPTLTFAHLLPMNFTCNGPFLSFLIAWAPFCLFYGEVRIRIGALEVGPARLIQYISGDPQLSKPETTPAQDTKWL